MSTQKVNWKWLLITLSLPVTLVIIAFAVMMTHQPTAATIADKQPAKYTVPLSYRIMQLSQEQVKSLKPAPTLAALEYAYIAKAYDDAYKGGTQAQAVYAAHQMMTMVFADKQAEVDSGIAQLSKEYAITSQEPSKPTMDIVATLQQRFADDGHDLIWNGIVPTGAGKWVPKPGVKPMTPRAGEWHRWNVTEAISVPPPPTYGSTQDISEINNTLRASSNRSGEDVNKINFWGGVPGTETPSGIWQNELFKTIEPDLKKNPEHADRMYSSIQSHLVTTLSDAFMECWKVKYTYWTARPDMRDSRIRTAMPDPLFPSYVSGHSTISKAAADVLSVQVPKYKDTWQSMAMDARQSRLKAGIHFEIDNSVGFQLGTDVAKQAIANLKMQRVL
jgi:hypothetical protein